MGFSTVTDAETSEGRVSRLLWGPDQGHGQGQDQRQGGGGGAPQPPDPEQEPPHHGAGAGEAVHQDKPHADADGTICGP